MGWVLSFYLYFYLSKHRAVRQAESPQKRPTSLLISNHVGLLGYYADFVPLWSQGDDDAGTRQGAGTQRCGKTAI